MRKNLKLFRVFHKLKDVYMDVNRKIRIDGDYLQSYQDDYMELQVDKMNQRVTFFSIVFIILMGISTAFGYFYIKSNVQKVPKEVQDLSHQVVQRMSTISERHTQMESSFQSKLSLLEKVTEALRKEQKEIQDAIDKINRTKADQNDVGRILGKSSQENFQAIEEVRSHLNSLNTTFTDQFSQFSEKFAAFNKDVNEVIQASITDIQKDTQTRMGKVADNIQTVSEELNSFGKNVNTLDSNMRTLKTDLDTLDKRISDLSSTVNGLSSEMTGLARSIRDIIDSEQLEELLAIERKAYKDNADLQKALIENHIKVLEEKLENLKQQINMIQSNLSQYRLNKKTIPKARTAPVANHQLPVKTKKKPLAKNIQ
ncbi:MAG: hypothetical protein OMM_01561 [Candidatus Magnetoglobus multicellularis str. Araruama]|uniref:Uncharacterized protein n=1 Tax=Candidatus Magnetoglobus multicellularis str. Araruama TaxID=890399 RepID=A0A1V1PCV7_9BACT|nr:MAG: hypothetical protein OMM_01561 [Candidatus Magnetoglobus multicellularis str. Araruama]